MSDTIILDRHKCNAELLTIHADGTITAAEHLKPTETAAEVLRIMRETWMADAQSIKIRDQQERIKRLEEALEATAKVIGPPGKSTWVSDDELNHAWELYIKAKEAKL